MPLMILTTSPRLGEGETPNMTTDAQAHIDDEITALTSSICNLRARRNTFSLISRLPPELLATIFIYCARSYEDSVYRSSAVPSWVNLSYICRHWREVALNCPTLWTYMFPLSPRWTDELFARSKLAPLKVEMHVGHSKQKTEQHLLDKVASHAGRLQHLSLKLNRREAERVFPKFDSRAPILQTLQITVERSGYLSETVTAAKTLFDGDTPALRVLELTNYSFSWTATSFSGLTTLRLRDLSTSSQPTIAEIKTVLECMQHIRYLYLENALPSAHKVPVCPTCDDSGRICLSHLSRFSIIAPFSTVVHLLSCLNIPLETEVRIRCCLDSHTSIDDPSPIYPLLAKRFNELDNQTHSSAPIIRTAVIETASSLTGFIFSSSERDCDRHSYSASMSSYEVHYLREDWGCDIPLKVDLMLRSSSLKDREAVAGNVCRSISMPHLSSLHLSQDVGTNFSEAFWKDTFGNLNELKYIKVTEGTSHNLVSVLTPNCPHLVEEETRNRDEDDTPQERIDQNQIFAPVLEELELASVEFAEECYDYCTGSATCLQNALSHRKKVGYGLGKLRLSDCMYVFEVDVEGFETVVTDVIWDGITRTASEFDEDEADEDEFEAEDDYYDEFGDTYGMGYFDDFYDFY